MEYCTVIYVFSFVGMVTYVCSLVGAPEETPAAAHLGIRVTGTFFSDINISQKSSKKEKKNE